MEGCIFDVARGSTHDGPGFRTVVFLKGCPLRCAWCHNPESQSTAPQLSYNPIRCVGCLACVRICPTGAHFEENGLHGFDRSRCVSCGKCAQVCPNKALETMGRIVTAEEVVETALRDKPFFDNTGGGLTLSGGEPLAQPEFSREVLRLAKEAGIHCCMETSGAASEATLRSVMPYTDLFLYDCKITDDALSRKYVGVEYTPLLKGLCMLLDSGKAVCLRCPVIPGVNDDADHLGFIAGLLHEYPALAAELLPYHNFGLSKSRQLGMEQAEFRMPTQEEKDSWIRRFREQGLTEDRIRI